MHFNFFKPTTGHNSKLWTLGPYSGIHDTSSPQVWYKFHRSRTTNIKVIEQNAFLIFWKPTTGHNSKSYGSLAPILVYRIHPVIVHVYTNFQLSSFHSSWEICYENFQEWQNLKTYQGTKLMKHESKMHFKKFWKPTKGHNSKSYRPLATILQLLLTHLRDQV